MSNSSKKTTRVQLELPDKSMERLIALKETTEAGSYSEVLKNALRLYESVILQYESGNRLCIKDEKGNLTEYQVFC